MSQPIKIVSRIRLKDFNPDFHEGLDKDEAREKTERLCRRIGEHQDLLHASGTKSLLILLQGMDTSGKDGAVKHVFDAVNPAGVESTSFKTPTSEEAAHDFLWRVHHAVPRYGNIGIFNRSHYEEVLVVRVLELKPRTVWQRHYEEINAFERLLTQNNVVLLKFFLHISREEQGRRLQARIDDPHKNWKFQPEDLHMRAHWNEFMRAYEDAINRCSTAHAPWHIIPANRKWFRDLAIARIVVDAMERMKLKWPKPAEGLSKIKIK